MKQAFAKTVTLIVLGACACLANAPADDDAGFTAIFDGKTLDGWTAPDMAFWRVEDGAITGEVTADRLPKENVFLVWKGEPVGDFELRFRFRITGADANSGMQFRSEAKDRGLVHGYQADMSGTGQHVGVIYDEYGPRNALAKRGERVTFDADGKKTVETFPDPFAGDAEPDLSKWTDYEIRAVGRHVTLKVNGRVTAELTDGDPRARLTGVLAVPVIPKPMKVQYKDLRLKRLDPER